MTPRRTTRLAALALIPILVLGCGITAEPVASPSPSPTPQASLSGAIALTHQQLVTILSAAGLQVVSPQVPFRPAESPLLAAAPRAVFQVPLPQDQSRGFILVYEFADTSAAASAGAEQARFVASGPGRVLFPNDAQFVLRQVGTTLVFYSWSPGAPGDPRTPEIATVLATIGTEIPVPR